MCLCIVFLLTDIYNRLRERQSPTFLHELVGCCAVRWAFETFENHRNKLFCPDCLFFLPSMLKWRVTAWRPNISRLLLNIACTHRPTQSATIHTHLKRNSYILAKIVCWIFNTRESIIIIHFYSFHISSLIQAQQWSGLYGKSYNNDTNKKVYINNRQIFIIII